jgi:hypothetical protein
MMTGYHQAIVETGHAEAARRARQRMQHGDRSAGRGSPVGRIGEIAGPEVHTGVAHAGHLRDGAGRRHSRAHTKAEGRTASGISRAQHIARPWSLAATPAPHDGPLAATHLALATAHLACAVQARRPVGPPRVRGAGGHRVDGAVVLLQREAARLEQNGRARVCCASPRPAADPSHHGLGCQPVHCGRQVLPPGRVLGKSSMSAHSSCSEGCSGWALLSAAVQERES